MFQPLLSTVDQLKLHREKLLQACHQALFAETADLRQLALNTAHHHREKMQATFTGLSNSAHLVSDFLRSPAPSGDDQLLANVEGLIDLVARKSSKMSAGSGLFHFGGAAACAAMPAIPSIPS